MGRAEKISGWIREMVKASGATGAVTGMSGGVDSSVTAVLVRKALGESCLGLIMPCQSSPSDESDARLVAVRFAIPTLTVPLNSVYQAFLSVLPFGDGAVRANLKTRVRMAVLYHYARNCRCLVVGTTNKVELLTGYFTKYGDGGADMLPLANLLKREVRELAEELEIPREIIDRVPTAGLLPGQTDERELGLTYEELDAAISARESGGYDGVPPRVRERLEELIRQSQHKRELIAVWKDA